MSLRLLACLTGLLILSTLGASAQQQTDGLASGVFNSLNRLRANPDSWIPILQERRRYYNGRLLNLPGKTPIRTVEGARAVAEAINSLQSFRGSLDGLVMSRGLTQSALSHVRDTGPSGSIGHEGSNGEDFAQRISRFGKWAVGIAENISYGGAEPDEVILQLLVDDGVSDRGHRRNLLDPRWHYVGVACGTHYRYQTMCVLDFAVQFQNK